MKLNILKFASLFLLSPVVAFDTSPAMAQNGCGDSSTATLLSILSPVGSRQFGVACNEHDACYDTLGKSKGDCDKAFHTRMLGICARDHNTIFGRPLKIACNGRADAYYSAVNRQGGDAYRKAQEAAQAGVPNPAPVSGCPPNYSPVAFQGRTAKVAFFNEWSVPVSVVLYHPDNKSIFNRFTVLPGRNNFLDNNIVVGDDWGVCFENKPSASGFVNNLGTISDHNNFQGSPLFMIQNPRIK